MCDQTEVSYLENDVVWVKIGPIWWPGVVKDLEKDEEGKEILAGLKKKPIAAVKFFQEDNYEFVKNLDHIYHYNCRRKDEFIKKGLDKFRSGASHMKKFPADVTTAETLVHGDVNIINDPKFYPEKKQSYSEIFGSGKKKNKKEVIRLPKSKLQTSSSKTPYRPITHQRFINKVLHGESDHKVRTLIQPTSSPEDIISRGIYKCHVCKFETSRVNVIVAHHRLTHSSTNSINWTGSDTKTVRRKPVHKSRKSKAKKLFESPKADSSDDEFLDQKKLKITERSKSLANRGTSVTPRKGSSSSPRKRKISEDAHEDNQKRPRYTEVLLADWSEEDEEEKKVSESGKITEGNYDLEDENDPENPSDSAGNCGKEELSGIDKGKGELKNQNEKMSCFDFDDEEEGFIGMSNANTYGRKIPRVIPVKDKPELGVDLEIGELFKRKSESDGDISKGDESILTLNEEKSCKNESDSSCKYNETEMEEKLGKVEDNVKETDKEEKSEKLVKRRRKSSKDQEIKVDEESLAVRRTRRPGAKKSYLNEVIEKVEDSTSVRTTENLAEHKEPELKTLEVPNILSRKAGKEDGTPSSRRKQDLKNQTMENSIEETIYSEIVSNETRTIVSADSPDKKSKIRVQQGKVVTNDDLTKKIDHLLAETNIPSLPEIPGTTESKTDNLSTIPETPKHSNTLNFSFDYVSPENADKVAKGKMEVKSITKMFSDTIKGSDNKQEKDRSHDGIMGVLKDTSNSKQGTEESDSEVIESQNLNAGSLKSASSPGTGAPRQFGSGTNSILSNESTDIQSIDVQIAKGGSPNEESCSSGSGSKIDAKSSTGDTKETGESLCDAHECISKGKSVKTLKLKADSLPSTLLSPSGKLKGQTIIHQKGGTYVILSQPPQLPRQKLSAAKGQTPGKLVILTNQHGEQKIITTSGLQQSKFKIDPQKVVVASSGVNNTSDTVPSTSGILSVGKTQPIIKMVPDGKGGVMKQLTVSPKKVLLGGTKVLVSGAGTTFSTQGNTIQKIALTSGNNLSGDYRLIENYKGSGKTVLIQGSPNASAGVLLKTSAGAQRAAAGDSSSGAPNILNLKKKPKILMRAAPNQNEYVVHSEISAVDSPTYVMKRKGTDGKFSTQKIIRRPVINPPKSKTAAAGTKTFFLSSEQPVKKADSIIMKTNQEVPANKIIRLTQKGRETEVKHKFAQKVIQKAPENFTVLESNILTTTESDEQEVKNEATQMVQVGQSQSQQPILQTQVMAMPGPIGSDGNQTYVLVSVDEHGVVQPVDNSLIAYDTSGQGESVFVNPGTNNNVIVINPQTNEEIKPVFSNGSQDILAEALANTNVLEGNISNDMESVMPSILLPPSIPSSVVQETSITLQKPIMTPLEMPTSVTPDTSGLEPPPLPPTPTEEDVLMEDQDVELQEGLRESQLINLESSKERNLIKKREVLMEENFSNEEPYRVTGELQVELAAGNNEVLNADRKEGEDGEMVGYFDQNNKGLERSCGQAGLREDLIENPQEEQGSNSLQSMPLLNDEPDTSDDAQGSEPIGDQDFELQKSRSENQHLSTTSREQEPPSSTNNEMMAESCFEKPEGGLASRCDHPGFQETPPGDATQNNESEKPQEDLKVKEVVENRDMPSMSVIYEDGSVNSYAYGQMYVDTLSQKRFQEETEVTSTTDEFSNKDHSNIV